MKVSSRKAEVLPGQTTVRIAFTTMRRGGDARHLYETMDSLIPFLGGEGSLHLSLTVVDVERAADPTTSFAHEIEQKYAALVSSGVLVVKTVDETARAALYEGLVSKRKERPGERGGCCAGG